MKWTKGVGCTVLGKTRGRVLPFANLTNGSKGQGVDVCVKANRL